MRRCLPALMFFAACSGEAPSPEPVAPKPVVAAPAPEPDTEAPAEPALQPPTEGRFNARHILIPYVGATAAPAGTSRSLAEAQDLAERLHAELVAGADFAELARTNSADPSGGRGGVLGVYSAGTMMPAFEAAVASVQPGELAPVVTTPYGVHVIRREPVVEGWFDHIVIGYAGANRSEATRGEDEALAMARAAQARLAAGEAWDAVAAEVSEDELAAHGGDLGLVAAGQLVPAFEDAAFALDVGAVSEPVLTPYGVHLIRRTGPPTR